jgi:hypothetical protein
MKMWKIKCSDLEVFDGISCDSYITAEGSASDLVTNIVQPVYLHLGGEHREKVDGMFRGESSDKLKERIKNKLTTGFLTGKNSYFKEV